MTAAGASARPARAGFGHPILLVALLFAAAAFLAWRDVGRHLPGLSLSMLLSKPDVTDASHMLVYYTMLPRMAVALISGAALALAGAICQQVLRNPLAEPTTLGVSAGAHLALSTSTLFAPVLLTFGREWVALAGASLAMLFVFGLAWSRALSPLSLVLAGLVVSVYCGAVGAVLVLFNHEYLIGLFIWGAGFLSQQDWSVAVFLGVRLAGVALLVALIARPLTLLGLDDGVARNLGLGLTKARLFALVLAVGLSASVVSAVGVLGFVGLAGPTLAALMGARRFRDRLVWAPLYGAGVLWLTDQLVLLIPSGYREIPTGTVTALLGAPMLLVLLPRLRTGMPFRSAAESTLGAVRRIRHPVRLLLLAILGTVLAAWLALAIGKGAEGWHWSGLAGMADLFPWRGPRLGAAIAAGIMLAVAGVLAQRLTGNPMAAPEVLGISSGAALGVILLLFIVPTTPDRLSQIVAGAGGALAVTAIILLLGRRAAFSPDRLLLAGVATSAVFGAVVALVMVTGDPRMGLLLTWMAGSTYQVSGGQALLLLAVAGVLLALTPLCARWLDILPLGAEASQELGVTLGVSRLAIMVLIALTTAAATLLVGPLSFVGLMAPHIARLMGLHKALHHILGAAAIGALIMAVADWAGRTVAFPFQVPAGLVATVIGGPYLMWLLNRRR